MKKFSYQFYKTLSIIFCIVTLFITEVFAWQSLNQESKNQLLGTNKEIFRVELIKLAKDINGNETDQPIQDTAFYLFTSQGKQVGTKYYTDQEGKIKVNLEKGDYYFEEINPSYGYDYDIENGEKKKKYPFTVAGNHEEVVVVKAYNLPMKGRLRIEKTVVNADHSEVSEEQKKKKFEFIVTFSNQGTYNYRIDKGEQQTLTSGGSLYLSHGQEATFENVPVGIQYNVKEKRDPDYVIDSIAHQGNIEEEGSVARFRNKYVDGARGKLVVTKEVRGEEIDPNKVFDFVATIDQERYEFQLKHGESKVFENVPIGVIYTVEEKDYREDGYLTPISYYEGRVINEEIQIPFVNVKGALEDRTNLIIKKQVLGTPVEENKKFTFEIKLEENDGVSRVERFELKANEEKVFENLKTGTKYEIKEIDTGGYVPVKEIQKGMVVGKENLVIFENKVPDEFDGISRIRVTKKLSNAYPEEDREKEFEMKIIVDGNETPFTLRAEESKEFEIFKGSIYEVVEKNYLEEGYSQTITNGFGTAHEEIIEVEVNNAYIKDEKVKICGEKKWDLNGEEGIQIPKSITVILKEKDLIVEKQVVTPNENGEWKYCFQTVKYDEDGKEIEYRIEEEKIEGFHAIYEGYNIINKYMKPVIISLPNIKKKIEGKQAPIEEFTFLMEGKQNAPMPEGTENGKKLIKIKGEGIVEIGTIQFQKEGEYHYLLSELNQGVKNWTYDNAKYELIVKVESKEENLDVTYEVKRNGEKRQEIEFINRYKVEEEQVCVPGPDGILGTEDDVCGVGNGSDDPVKLPDGSVQVPPGGSVIFPEEEMVVPDGAIIHPDGIVILPNGMEYNNSGILTNTGANTSDSTIQWLWILGIIVSGLMFVHTSQKYKKT